MGNLFKSHLLNELTFTGYVLFLFGKFTPTNTCSIVPLENIPSLNYLIDCIIVGRNHKEQYS